MSILYSAHGIPMELAGVTVVAAGGGVKDNSPAQEWRKPHRHRKGQPHEGIALFGDMWGCSPHTLSYSHSMDAGGFVLTS